MAQLGARFHGMEEVVGSIPTRSTKHPAMFFAYILQSRTTQRFYIGSAADPEKRLADHNRGQTRSTRGRGPWDIVHTEAYPTLADARRREQQLKSWKSHRSLQELISEERL